MRAGSLLAFLLAASLFAAPWPARGGEPNPHNSSKCLLCHQKLPRFGVDTKETVTFRGGKTSDDPALCAFCHKPEENLHPILVTPGPDMLASEQPSLLPLGENGFINISLQADDSEQTSRGTYFDQTIAQSGAGQAAGGSAHASGQ